MHKKQRIELLVIHCTATPAGREVSAKEIRQWHTSPEPHGRGWKQVGYTDMVHLNGRVERLAENNEDEFVDGFEITNGAKGINYKARNIVYVGGVDAKMKPCDTRTVAQREALRTYVLDFIARFPWVRVAGHSDFANKACPSFSVVAWCKAIGIPSKNIYAK